MDDGEEKGAAPDPRLKLSLESHFCPFFLPVPFAYWNLNTFSDAEIHARWQNVPQFIIQREERNE